MAEESRTASRTGYVIAAGIFLAGVVVAGALLLYVIFSIIDMDENLQHVAIPGTAELRLEETGQYTAFYERQSGIDERGFDTGDDPPELEIRVVETATGNQIPVSRGFGDISYDFWSRSGDSVASFEISEPGTYEITVEYAGDTGSEDDEAVLAVGQGIGTTIILVIVAALGSGAFFCGTLGVAVIVLIITLVRRSRTPAPSAQV